jgi:thioredoxin reductase
LFFINNLMTNQLYQWAVVGAGPAGLAAVGKLLDKGIHPKTILWLDPYFMVGDLGRLWQQVSSNTTVGRFVNFLNDATAFAYQKMAHNYHLSRLALDNTCQLTMIVHPLQSITNDLKQQVYSVTDTICSIELTQRQWLLSSQTQTFHAKNVILATGALPTVLNYPGIDTIPFNIAIDKQRLSNHIDVNQTIAVFGSSHSAFIIIRHLVELKVKKIINFYRSPCRYAVDFGDWILFDNTGLKGTTAAWAREYIDGTWPDNLVRYSINEQQMTTQLIECQQTIYAVGFQPRDNIAIKGYESVMYNPHVGIIAPGLFGLGIAYPEQTLDKFGNTELHVGLWKFMVYLNNVLPIWLVYGTDNPLMT